MRLDGSGVFPQSDESNYGSPRDVAGREAHPFLFPTRQEQNRQASKQVESWTRGQIEHKDQMIWQKTLSFS